MPTIHMSVGHGKAIKDISFNHDGTNFVSAGYDRHIKLWDTETGECVRRFCNHKLPYCIQFHPGGVSHSAITSHHLFVSYVYTAS